MALIPVANMEASDRPCFEGVYEPVSRADAIVNCLDLPAINQFYAQLRSTNVIRETATTIRTGGGLNGVRFPSVNATISTKIQARPGVNSLAHAQIVQYRQAHALPLYDQYNINVGHLIWRKRHVNVAGQPRKVMQTVELSHHAEAYHSDAFFAALNVTANQRATSKVEVAEMEVAAIMSLASSVVCCRSCGASRRERSFQRMILVHILDLLCAGTDNWEGLRVTGPFRLSFTPLPEQPPLSESPLSTPLKRELEAERLAEAVGNLEVEGEEEEGVKAEERKLKCKSCGCPAVSNKTIILSDTHLC